MRHLNSTSSNGAYTKLAPDVVSDSEGSSIGAREQLFATLDDSEDHTLDVPYSKEELRLYADAMRQLQVEDVW